MSTIDLNKIIQLMNDAQFTASQRGPMITIALARAIGYGLQLPTSEVADPSIYYINNAQALAEAAVSQVNEQVAVDVTKACDLVRSVWLFRYRLVYQANNSTVRNFLDGLVRVGSTEFPGYVSELMTLVPEGNMLDYIASIVKEGFSPSAEGA